jgi:RimJ/RimL family protein N-acetyltransferase
MKRDTRRLQIETLRRHHAALLFPALVNPRAYLFIPERPPISRNALARRYVQLERGAPPLGSEIWLNWVLRLRVKRVYVGTLQATILRGHAAHIAYMIAPRFWHRGYATEACAWLIGHLVAQWHVVDFRASVDPRNVASSRLLENLGFTRVGERPAELHGKPTIDHLYRRVRVVRDDGTPRDHS